MVKGVLALISLLLVCEFAYSASIEESQPDLEAVETSVNDEDNVEISAATKKYRISTPFKSIFIYGAPYPPRTNGEYVLQDNLVNGYPVYQKEDFKGGIWSFYRKSSGKWHLDLNTPDEERNGTVTHSTTAGPLPFLLEYNSGGIVIPHNKLFTQLMPYHNGEYTCEGQVYNNAPVFKAAETFQGYQFYIYKRQNGKWYVDFDGVIDESWGGTVAYTLQAAPFPYNVEWNN